jgi:hypothetical protein
MIEACRYDMGANSSHTSESVINSMVDYGQNGLRKYNPSRVPSPTNDSRTVDSALSRNILMSGGILNLIWKDFPVCVADGSLRVASCRPF